MRTGTLCWRSTGVTPPLPIGWASIRRLCCAAGEAARKKLSDMPKTQRPTKAALARLARLPRRSDLVIEGGKRPLGVRIHENEQTVEPQLALWLDAQSGFIRGTAMINPLESTDGGIGEALAALVDAATNPVVAPLAAPARDDGARPVRLQPPPPGLPTRIVVDDAALADAARAIFTPLDVPVEVAEQLPAFDEAFDSVAPYLGARPDAEPPQPFSWEIDAALLPALYKAAATYARRAPWQYMPDHPPVAVRLGANGPEPGVDTLYASIMGGGGQVIGMALYYSLDDYRSAVRRGAEIGDRDENVEEAIDLLRQAGAPVDQMEPNELRELVAGFMEQMEPGRAEPPEVFENSLVFFLEEKDESDPTYLEWLTTHGLKYTRHNVPFFLKTAAGSKPRQPDEREVRALTLAIDALAQFFKEYERVLQGPFLPVEGLSYQAHVQNNSDKVAVDVRFPPENYDWDEDLADEWDEDDDNDLDEDDE